MEDRRSWKDIKIREAFVAGASAAVTGNVVARYAGKAFQGAYSANKAIAKTAVAGGIGGAAGPAINSGWAHALGEENPYNGLATKMAVGAIAGGATGAVGGRVINAGAKKLEKMQAAGGLVAGISATTRSAAQGGNTVALGTATGAGVATFVSDSLGAGGGKHFEGKALGVVCSKP